MIDKNFYKNKGPFSLSYLISQLNLDYTGDGKFLISDIAPLDSAGPNEITFFMIKDMKINLKKLVLELLSLIKNSFPRVI